MTEAAYISDNPKYRHMENAPVIENGLNLVTGIAGIGKSRFLSEQAKQEGGAYTCVQALFESVGNPRAIREELDRVFAGKPLIALDDLPPYRDYPEEWNILNDWLQGKADLKVLAAVRKESLSAIVLSVENEIRLGSWKKAAVEEFFDWNKTPEEVRERYFDFIGKDTQHHIPKVVALFSESPETIPEESLQAYLCDLFSTWGHIDPDCLKILAALARAPSPSDKTRLKEIYDAVAGQRKDETSCPKFLYFMEVLYNNKVITYQSTENRLQLAWDPAVQVLLQGWLRWKNPDLFKKFMA